MGSPPCPPSTTLCHFIYALGCPQHASPLALGPLYAAPLYLQTQMQGKALRYEIPGLLCSWDAIPLNSRGLNYPESELEPIEK